MHKRKKLWVGISAITLAGATGLVGCSQNGEQGESATEHSQAVADGHTMKSGEGHGEGEGSVHKGHGEGEGGEGASEGEGENEGSIAKELSVNDLAYLAQLGLMRGHLYVGYELYKAGHIEHAKMHMKHPEHELYAAVIPAFEARGSKGFAGQLKNLAASVEQNGSSEEVDKAYQVLAKAIAENEAAVGDSSQSVAQKLKLVVNLLRTAADEYGIAVVNGKMENAHEYQDALGFTHIARGIISSLDDGIEAKAQAAALVDGLKPLWPSLIPPETLSTEAGQLYGVAAKVELLALGQ